MNAKGIKKRFSEYVEKNGYPPSVASRGVYIGKLNKACGGDANRKLLLKYLTDKTSTKVLSDAEWRALKKFVDVDPVDLELMCKIVLGEVVKVDGQLDMFEERQGVE